MITQDEAFWAGIAVATMMLGGGFSMLFVHAYTGYGAVVLSLGLMTMAVTLQARAKAPEPIEPTAPIESRILAPTTPVERPNPVEESEPLPKPVQAEAEAHIQLAQSEANEYRPVEVTQPTEALRPAEEIERPKPAQHVQADQPPTTEPLQPPQPEAPLEKKPEPPKSEQKPKEEPQAVAAAT